MTNSMQDPKTGLFIPQPVMPMGNMGLPGRKVKGFGAVTYRCHTCGESIVKPWEVMFVDDTPGRDHSSNIAPGKVSRRTTTHHDWHMASQQHEED